jgi:hypothetical protein
LKCARRSVLPWVRVSAVISSIAVQISPSQRQANSAIFSHLAEVSALGQLGRSEEAADAIARARLKKPDFSISYVAEALPITDDACREIFHGGVRKAGVPE